MFLGMLVMGQAYKKVQFIHQLIISLHMNLYSLCRGAEETEYGLQCVDNWLASPSGQAIKPDVIYFNFGKIKVYT